MRGCALASPISRDEHQPGDRMAVLGAQPGCAGSRLLRDVDDDGVLVYLEQWGSRELLERHLRSGYYRKLLAVMEMASEPPEIRFDTISERRGMGLVEEVRAPVVRGGDPAAEHRGQPRRRSRR